MTFRQARSWAAARLAQLKDPDLEARLLILHVTGWKQHTLFLNLDRPVPADDLIRFRDAVERRASREPLQHITGRAWFLDREFLAGPEALVPRPETETLLLEFMKLLFRPRLLLDLGTGSGIMAVTLACRYPDALVLGSDLSGKALALAADNSRVHGAENVAFVQGNMLRPFRGSCRRFDGIVANLPYIPSPEIAGLQPEVTNGDPVMALDGGPDGLDLVRDLLSCASELLKQDGVIALELDTSQTENVADSLSASGEWSHVAVANDLGGRPRVVTAMLKNRRRFL